MFNADFKRCAGNSVSPYCLGMTEFNCCGIGMEHEYRDKDVSEFNYCEKGMESEADPAGKGKDSEDDFVHSSPKAKRNKLSLCKRKVLSPSSRFNTTACTEEITKTLIEIMLLLC